MFVLTDAAGVFNLADVPVGIYTLKAAKPRVGQFQLAGVEVVEGQVTDVGQVSLAGQGSQGPKGPKHQYQQGGGIR